MNLRHVRNEDIPTLPRAEAWAHLYDLARALAWRKGKAHRLPLGYDGEDLGQDAAVRLLAMRARGLTPHVNLAYFAVRGATNDLVRRSESRPAEFEASAPDRKRSERGRVFFDVAEFSAWWLGSIDQDTAAMCRLYVRCQSTRHVAAAFGVSKPCVTYRFSRVGFSPEAPGTRAGARGGRRSAAAKQRRARAAKE